MWPSIQKNVHHWCKSCKKCQIYGKFVLKAKFCKKILAFKTFEKWGADAKGPLPLTSRGKIYILTAVNYLLCWVITSAVRQVTTKNVVNFVYKDICCCKFGVPLELLSNQELGFRGDLL